MRSAQSLYEAGYITYMRTDSTTLSDTALPAARREITERYGAQFVPDAPRTYAKKVKNAQEAHEAIRPAGDSFRSPEDVAREVNANDAKVYELIWKRTIASQMTDATGETVTVRLGAANPTPSAAALALAGRPTTVQLGRRRVLHQRHDHHPPGLPPRLRRRPRRGRRRRRAGAPAAAADRGRPRCRPARSRRTATRPSRRPASPRRRWSSGSRSSASAARRPTRRPSR